MTAKRVNSKTIAKLRILVQQRNELPHRSQHLKRVTQKEGKKTRISSWGAVKV